MSFLEAKRLFFETLERGEAWLHAACPDPALRDEVRALLAADASEEPAPRIEGYEIVRRIGEGGMGVVYEAEQRSPRRRVALKVLPLALGGEDALRRFAYETEALARLDHPGIARIHATGAAEGRPWFAMEFVDGEPLAQHAARLGVASRVELLIEVCEAVQHAHDRGVLHRDLKPGNVLVDRSGRPRLLDFGVAKLLGDVATLHTRTGQLVGTLPYMSPEQLGGDDADVRSDVYALGVIAFELFAGKRPVDVARLSLHEAIVRLRETDVPRPPGVAADLATIVGKATAREPARRYASAGAFAADLRRYLRHEPVEARPPSVTYQLGKFARRHRALVAGASAVLLAGAAGVAATVREYRRAVAAEARASAEASAAEQAVSFLVRTFREADPTRSRGETLTVREALDAGAAALESEPPGAVRSRLQHALAEVYHGLGLHERAEVLAAEALAERRARYGGDHEEVAESLFLLAETRHYVGRLERLEELYGECLAMQRRLFGSEDARVAQTVDVLGRLLRARGDLDGAEALHREAMEIRRRVAGEKSRDFGESLQSLAFLHHTRGELGEAKAMYERAIALRRELGGDGDPRLPELLHALGTLLSQERDHAGAERVLARCVESTRAAYGETHYFVANPLMALGDTLSRQGRHAEARARLEEATAVVGEGHHLRPLLLMSIGNTWRDEGEHARAVEYYERAAELYRATGQAPSLVIALQNRATTLTAMEGRADEAEATMREAIALQARLSGPDAHATLHERLYLLDVLIALGRLDAARAELEDLAPRIPEASSLRPRLDALRNACAR